MATRIYGTIRTSDCTDASLVTACGVYLTFRLPANKPVLLRHLVEVRRTRAGGAAGQKVDLHRATLTKARTAALAAIAQHRHKMNLRIPARMERSLRPVQLLLPLIR